MSDAPIVRFYVLPDGRKYIVEGEDVLQDISRSNTPRMCRVIHERVSSENDVRLKLGLVPIPGLD
jgi:hypothetical protein